MKIHTYTRLVITLDGPYEQFTGRDNYGDDDVEIKVDTIELNGSTIWGKGKAYKKNGELGNMRREVVLDFDQIPAEILKQLAGHFIDMLDQNDNVRLVGLRA